ncbi:hypothetical protein LTR24_004538 [Lithohypha guttulata]|uniref:Uncharacterized protein n=1 Tax=Lithohypha guttulata TaxID=1690604 RepID=A0ABR0KC27_9EURO|nr:hypothetical protein LTR24_004538 [Lithohypha guttulata]
MEPNMQPNMQPYVQAPDEPRRQVYDKFAASGAPQMQMQMPYGVQRPYTPPHHQYGQFSVQAPITYPHLFGPLLAGIASFYRTQGCMQDQAGRWYKLLSGCDKRTYHFTPLRILPNGIVCAIVDGKMIWSDASPLAYPVAPQMSASGQLMNGNTPTAFLMQDTTMYQQNMPAMTNNMSAGMPMQNMPAYQQNLPLPAATNNMPSDEPTPPFDEQLVDPQLFPERDQGVDMGVSSPPQPPLDDNFNIAIDDAELADFDSDFDFCKYFEEEFEKIDRSNLI